MQATHQQRLLQAEQLIQEGNYAAAESQLKALITENPNFGPAYNHLAWLAAQASDFDTADRLYRQGLTLSPNFPATYFNYLVFLRNLRRFEAMEAGFIAGLAGPEIRRDILNAEYGTGLEAAQQFDLAIEHYKESIRHAFNQEDITAFQQAIARCELKSEI